MNGRHTIRPTASEIWLDLVSGLQRNVELRTHRTLWRRHEDCFRGDEAVTALRHYMMTESQFYRYSVPRSKVVKLIEKFRQCGIIVPVDPSAGAQFVGGSGLYRFGRQGTVTSLSAASNVLLSSLPPILTPRQIELIYADVCLEFLRAQLKGSKAAGLLDAFLFVEESAQGNVVMNNLHHVDRDFEARLGVVAGVNDDQDPELSHVVQVNCQVIAKHLRSVTLSPDMIRGMLSVVSSYFRMICPVELVPRAQGCLIMAALSSRSVPAVQIALLTLPLVSYRVLQRYILVMNRVVSSNNSLKCHVDSCVGLIDSRYRALFEELLLLSPGVWAVPEFVRDQVDGLIDTSQRR